MMKNYKLVSNQVQDGQKFHRILVTTSILDILITHSVSNIKLQSD